MIVKVAVNLGCQQNLNDIIYILRNAQIYYLINYFQVAKSVKQTSTQRNVISWNTRSIEY